MSHPTIAPALIIVSGAPGTGKTTLGRRIAGSLGIPYVGKDLIKESLFDSLGTQDREWSMRLGVASIELMSKLIESHLMLGLSLVAESNFRVQYDIPRFAGFAERYAFKSVEVHCSTERQVLHGRLERRDQSGERHAGHETGGMLDEIDRLVDDGTFGPLDLGGTTIRVHTTAFETVDYDAIIASAKAAGGL